MFKEGFRILAALLALGACVAAARADSVSVTESCVGCWGAMTGEHRDAFPMFYSTTSDFSSPPGIGAKSQMDVPWLLVLNAGRFTTISPDGKMTIGENIREFDVTFTPVFHQPRVKVWTATDTVQRIDGMGKEIGRSQTGAKGSGMVGSSGLDLHGSSDFNFDVPKSVPEPGTLLLLSAGLLALAPWVRRHK